MTTTLPDRFWCKVDRSGECWIWVGAVSSRGYGSYRNTGGSGLPHRLAYIDAHGPVPAGLELDHLCRNRRCVNPAHLEAVTRLENVRRGRRTRLSPTDVAAIVAAYGPPRGQGARRAEPSMSALARQYGVSPARVHQLIHGGI